MTTAGERAMVGQMMGGRMMLPVRGRDVAAGLLVWVSLVLIAAGRPAALPGSLATAAGTAAGLLVLAGALGYVMPYGRPWPLVQWRMWRQRRAMAFGHARPVGLLVPTLTRSAFGLLAGEWLGARLVERLAPSVALPPDLPAIGGLIVAAVLAVTVVLEL
jgi:hypothetical protein